MDPFFSHYMLYTDVLHDDFNLYADIETIHPRHPHSLRLNLDGDMTLFVIMYTENSVSGTHSLP